MTEPNVSGETVPNSGSEPSAALPEFSKPKRACTSSLSLRQVFYLCLVGLALLLAAWAVWRVSRPPEIPVERLRPETIEISLAVVGTVKPDQLIDVRSPNAGQIAALYLDEGAMIAEGAPMAVVRAVIEYAQVDAAAARQRAATAEVSRARLAFLRTRSLAEKGVAAEAALDEARATFEAAEAELAAATADRRAADARAGEFTILAPIAGLVLERPVENGQFVSNQNDPVPIGIR
jgi:RND family efflux transporter MFP subunit